MILGVDVGKHGALAVISITGDLLAVASFSGKTTEQIVWYVYNYLPYTTNAYIEQVSSSPQQGVVSAFTFGKNYGALLGALYSHPKVVTKIRPSEWQGALGCLSGGSKKSLLEFAKKLYPEEHKAKMFNKSSADAVLIAHYGYKKYCIGKEGV